MAHPLVSSPVPERTAARLVETHISTLFFVDGLVYKRKRPLDLGFADFREREARQKACAEEVRLNRRLSPDVYLGVADVLGPDGSPCDHLMVMRELPGDCRLSTLVIQGREVSQALDSVAQRLAGLHRSSPAPTGLRAVATGPGIEKLWEQGLETLAGFPGAISPGVTARTRALALRWLVGRRDLLDRRIDDGRVFDGHGDLLADDIFVLPDGPRILDCLEFDPRLRACDGLADAAFLAMDLESLGANDAGRYFLDAYRAAMHDDAPQGLEDHYLAYRAHVRAKVACLRGGPSPDGEPGRSAMALAELALAHLERARVRLILIGGLPGSGKTALAGALAHEHGWLHLSSDIVRKELTESAPGYGFERGRYAPDVTARTYSTLLDRAGRALRLGTSVILDASFGKGASRDAARRLAAQACADLIEVQCVVSPELADERIRQRTTGPSEATPEIRAALARQAEPWPQAAGIDTAGRLDMTLKALDALACPHGHADLLPLRG